MTQNNKKITLDNQIKRIMFQAKDAKTLEEKFLLQNQNGTEFEKSSNRQFKLSQLPKEYNNIEGENYLSINLYTQTVKYSTKPFDRKKGQINGIYYKFQTY